MLTIWLVSLEKTKTIISDLITASHWCTKPRNPTWLNYHWMQEHLAINKFFWGTKRKFAEIYVKWKIRKCTNWKTSLYSSQIDYRKVQDSLSYRRISNKFHQIFFEKHYEMISDWIVLTANWRFVRFQSIVKSTDI